MRYKQKFGHEKESFAVIKKVLPSEREFCARKNVLP